MKSNRKLSSLILSLLLAGQCMVFSAAAAQVPQNLPAEGNHAEIESLNTDVPQYYQNDYPSTPFGTGTVATDGGSITALAMVASYVKDREYLPDSLAKNYGSLGTSHTGRIEYISLALSLSCKKAADGNTLLSALSEGKIAIAQMAEGSLFSGEEHFLVLAGLTQTGKVIVLDPWKPNYDDAKLKDGFLHGFPKEDILSGCIGGWIYGSAKAGTHIHGSATPLPQTAKTSTVKTAVSETAVFSKSKVPLYFQTDYPNDRFGYGTVASSGCSITSLAMVATYLTGHKYTPDELADYCGGHGENNIDRMEYGADLLQLPWKKAENIHEVMAAVKEGDIAIVLMGQESIFTESQHFIVLTGMTEDGKILVNDSYQPNYDHWRLKKAFQTGFTEGDILLGYSGAWIYDVDAMPEDPFIYIEEKPYVAPRYPGIDLTWEEQQLLAKVIWVEARGESKEGQQAVAEVIYNRMLSSEFPNTLTEVIFAEGQFESVPYLEEAELTQAQYEALEDALSGPYVLPIEVVHFSRTPANENVWGTIGGHVFCYSSETYMGK